MKKVLSVLLAAAMVMGMSVSTFAATNKFFKPDPDAVNNTNVENIKWENVIIFDEDDDYKATVDAGEDYDELEAGDQLFFRVYGMEKAVCEDCDDAGKNSDECDHVADWSIDQDWIVKVNNEEFVDSIELYFDDEATDDYAELKNNIPYVKVVIADDFNHFEEDETTDFWFYIYDTDEKKSSDKARVKYDFNEYPVVYLCDEDCTKSHGVGDDKDNYKVIEWEENGCVVELEDPAIYVLCDCKKCYKASQKVMFSIEHDDVEVYFQAKMIPGEEYLTKITSDYNKSLAKAYDYDMQVLTIDTELKVDAIFEAAKDEYVVLEVVDGELYEVESEFVTKYEVIEDEILTKGYKVTNIDNGQFVLVAEDADLDLEDDTRKDVVVEDTTSTDKENPSTGANDFVGAAVALAVVSVAAAGALAFKK